ncbi:MAG: CPBP family intramembrane metalloprotease [Candidatus Lokiarchaeota archaeon]|nr:CPBP family intramembrane metalloprotease [Candidatus Lokiarchaeota archaeon]
MSDVNPESPADYSTHIVTRRFYVLLEVFMLMLLNFLIIIGLQYLIRLIPISESNPYQGLMLYGTNLLSVLIATILSLIFVQLVFYKSKLPLLNPEPPLKETYSLFTFKNFGTQLLFTFLLLFLVYIPLDFLTYSLPGGLDYSKRSLNTNPDVNAYLNFPSFVTFIIYSIFLHLMVGIREETFFRGYLTVRAEKYLNPSSSILISSLYFGLSHFAYLFTSENLVIDILPAIVWSLGGFLVGSISATFLLKNRMIWPIILAHTLNNVISSSALWLYSTQNFTLWNLAKLVYFPLIGVSVILAALFFRELRTGIKSYLGFFKSYKIILPEPYIRRKIILADIFFGLLFWAIGIFFI